MRKIAAAGVLVLLLFGFSSAADVSNFEIVSINARWEGTYLWAVGEVKNLGGTPAGVQVQVIVRDKAGKLVDTATFWPCSTSNIPPGKTCGIKHPVTREKSVSSIEARIIGSKQWR